MHRRYMERVGSGLLDFRPIQEEFGPGTWFFLRVDDFPRGGFSLSEFLGFHAICCAYGIPYLLGVTPLVCLQPLNLDCEQFEAPSGVEWDFLRREPLVTAALHGLTHRTRTAKPHSELLGLTDKDLYRVIDAGLASFRSEGIPVQTFIPPFNSLDHDNLRVLSRHFPVVCGGPESVASLGLLPPFCVAEGAVYVPSYAPAYGRASQIAEYVARLDLKLNRLVPLTVHWTWELGDGLQGFDRLCKLLQGRMLSWELVEDWGLSVGAR